MISQYIESFKDRKRALTFISDMIFLVFIVLLSAFISGNLQDEAMVKSCKQRGVYDAITFSGKQQIRCIVD